MPHDEISDDELDPHMRAKDEILSELMELLSSSKADRVMAKKRPIEATSITVESVPEKESTEDETATTTTKDAVLDADEDEDADGSSMLAKRLRKIAK